METVTQGLPVAVQVDSEVHYVKRCVHIIIIIKSL